MPWTAIVNPAAGRGRTRKLLDELTRAATAAGVAVEVSPDPDAPARLAKEAAASGHDLVACGGDGVVSEVAAVAADTGVRLAIVPTGAGNDFARELGYDTKKHPLAAFDALAGRRRRGGRSRPGQRALVHVRHRVRLRRGSEPLGEHGAADLGHRAVRRRDRAHARGLQPAPVPPDRRRRVHEFKAWLVAVGNGPAYAGGMHITPNASMHDGLLDVTVIGDLSKPALLWAFPRVFKGTHVTHPAAKTFRGEHVELVSLSPDTGEPMDVYADGERVGPLPGGDGRGAGRARRARAASVTGLRSASRRPPPAPAPPPPAGFAVAAASAASTVVVAPVTVTTPSMPASRWPGMVQ